jgi:hypothetical protein
MNRMKTEAFNREEWERMGGDICNGIGKYIKINEEYEESINERRREKERRKFCRVNNKRDKFF